MKKSVYSIALALGIGLVLVGTLPAQSTNASKRGPGMTDAWEKPDDAKSLTEEQKVTVTAILSKYNASTLTVDNAKAIHKALRDAGIRGGPGLNEVVKFSGFDPEKLRCLDPPPARKDGMEKIQD